MPSAATEHKNVLVIRADNMGDVIMSGPAIRALKDTFRCRITLLTSKMGAPIAPHMPAVDDLIVADLPWVKTGSVPAVDECFVLAERLRSLKFDLAVIFTVYSQSALPAAMLAFFAGIPRRLAYCRENPYQLLTDWVPDREPYSCILHQVERDLELVRTIGAWVADDSLQLKYSAASKHSALEKAADQGLDIQKPWVLLHPGVSDPKREYPPERWIGAGTLLQNELGFQVVISGSQKEAALAAAIKEALPSPAWSLAGALGIEEFIAFVSLSSLVISVNTATAHIAAALHRPLLVLYANTNPQHTPWNNRSEVLYFSGKDVQSSRNEVVRWVQRKVYNEKVTYPDAQDILAAVQRLLHVSVGTRLNIE